ncbi:MAG: phage head closure protein [Eubacteriales bacterium]
MNIAGMRVKIKLQRGEMVVDEIGNHQNEWLDYYSCFASVSDEGGKEQNREVEVVDSSTLHFTIRYCKAVSLLTSTKYRVVFEEELYNIVSINHMNYGKKCIKLKCEKVNR